MRKMKLDPEELRVESFDTIPAASRRGTVEAREQEWTAAMGGYTCQAQMTCFQDYSCPAFSCVSQCDRNCFEDWSQGCNFETAANTCWSCTCGQTCGQSCGCQVTVNNFTCPFSCAPNQCA